jgi:hypothetical protein
MNNMKKIIAYIGIAGLAVFIQPSCTKKFEEINTNPNNPVKAPTTNVLAWVLETFGASFFDSWGNMNEPETYGGHLGKIQYVDEARYIYRTGTVTSLWNSLYRISKNAQNIIEQAKTDNAVNMQAAAMTFQAFMWQIATDRWRDLPFTQAIRGDEGFITPQYDKQEDIYPALITQLKTAADLFAQGASDQLGSGDLLYNGDLAKWKKFCNSLRLRMAIRISNIDAATAKSIVEEITGDPTKYPVFTSNADNAIFMWTSATPYQEPWYNDFKTRDDHGISKPLVDSLKSLNDPRLSIYAKPAPTDGEYRGVEIGPPGTLPAIGQYSRIGTSFRETPEGFTPFMRYSEVQFILAEAALKGWNTGIPASTAYTNGITASMNENGITDAIVINAYIASSKVVWNGDVKKIYMQKWLSLYKNGHETWAEERRTDFPLLPAASGSPFPGHSRPPFRYPYPTEETTLNGNNSAAFVADIKDDFWGKKMWWDTRTGVQ